MLLFTCDVCGHQLYFESTECVQCHSPLGFLPEERSLTALVPVSTGGSRGASTSFRVKDPRAPGMLVRPCLNSEQYSACNWLVPAESSDTYCVSCALSEMIPNLSNEKNLQAWRRLEAAKRRLLFTLSSLGLPVKSKALDPEHGLVFRFLESTPEEPVTTGHANGVITVNIAEADHVFRENERERLGEAYRTTLGHLRHESGHYYFERLLQKGPELKAFRDLFGDERQEYGKAVERHYAEGPPSNWIEGFISAYATMHPWEDWAESWAHYLHMVDTLETAKSYGLAVRQPSSDGRGKSVVARAVDQDDFDDLMQGFYAFTLALNGLNRSMGLPDAYPFAVSPPARKKLAFVHQLIQAPVGRT